MCILTAASYPDRGSFRASGRQVVLSTMLGALCYGFMAHTPVCWHFASYVLSYSIMLKSKNLVFAFCPSKFSTSVDLLHAVTKEMDCKACKFMYVHLLQIEKCITLKVASAVNTASADQLIRVAVISYASYGHWVVTAH